MRVLGIDLGERRVGVAVSDRTGTLASPHSVLRRGADRQADRRAIAALVAELEAERVVVGLPRSLDGSDGPAARAARAEAEALAEVVGVPVELHDERLTTVSADRALAAGAVAGRRRREAAAGRERRAVIDKAAAAVMLQSWLDGRRA